MLKRGHAFALLAALAAACSRSDTPSTPTDATGPQPPPADAASADPGAIVLIADAPSHGPREHEYHAGTTLLATLLAQTPGATTRTFRAFPDDATELDGAGTIVMMTSGGVFNPLVVPGRVDALAARLARGVGFVAIHFTTDVPEELSPRMLGWAGGHSVAPQSVYAVWTGHFDTIPEHPITRGVAPFVLEDEFYYNLRLDEAAPGVTPILRALQPDIGRAQTVAWAFERADGGRSFSYVGLHFHDRWLRPEVRRLIVNAILWTARRDVPPAGAPVEMDPALIDRDLDPK